MAWYLTQAAEWVEAHYGLVLAAVLLLFAALAWPPIEIDIEASEDDDDDEEWDDGWCP